MDPITTDSILTAAREHGLELAAVGEVDQTGFDFAVLHGFDTDGVRWIVRYPRREEVMVRAATERVKLELVRAHVPFETPEWRVCSDRIIAYPRLCGEPSAVVDMSAGGYVWRFDETSPPPQFLDSLAAALAALHRIDPADARNAGLGVISGEGLRRLYAERIARAVTMIDVPDDVRTRWQRWLDDDAYWSGAPVVIHGDLHPGHILVDDEHRVTGLLDWTEAKVSDAAQDFQLLYATLGRGTIARLLELYAIHGGRVAPRMLDHIAETWAAYPTMITEFVEISGVDATLPLAQTLVDAVAGEERSEADDHSSQ